MRANKTASRYAKSLLLLAVEQKMLEEAFKDMTTIDQVAREEKDFRILLNSKVINADQKMAVMREVFKGLLGELSVRFIKIITDHGRENLLDQIAASFIQQYKNHKNIVTAEITSAVELTKEDKERVRSLVAEMGDGTVEIKEEVNKELIGGLIVRVGDKQIDASVATHLETLKRELINKTYESQL